MTSCGEIADGSPDSTDASSAALTNCSSCNARNRGKVYWMIEWVGSPDPGYALVSLGRRILGIRRVVGGENQLIIRTTMAK